MTPALERSFSAFIDERNLIRPSDRVIAAVSGGIDSMVLLRLLSRLRSRLPFSLEVAHVNHGLRGEESDGDERFVRDAAVGLGVPFHLHRWDPPESRADIQRAAREERYRFLLSLARSSTARTRVATAHTRDDNAETVLFNFLRGSGVRGLAGIPVVREDGIVVRPLLDARREEIEQYARGEGVEHRTDSSNDDPAYTRNRIRRSVMPALESAVHPGIRGTLARTSALFGELDRYLEAEAGRLFPEIASGTAEAGIRLDAERLAGLPKFLSETLIRRAAREFLPGGAGFEAAATIHRLLASRPGTSCLVARPLQAVREAESLLLRRPAPGDPPFDFPVTPGDAYRFGHFAFSSAAASSGTPRDSGPLEADVDADLLGDDLRLRSRRDGDWFVPLGMRGRKKLSDYLIDRKIPASVRGRIPLLVSGDDVVWVCGERLDERFRTTGETRRILRLRYEPLPL